MAGDVVLGYDGSEGSQAALAVAVTVARAFDATLAVVFGYEPSPVGGEVADYRRQLEKLGADVVAKAVQQASQLDADVTVDAVVVPMRPVESLLAAADERAARVIVVGGTG
ncbi:MAG TPA: universal stress protein [Acidimicrobiales bacterium]|nr:universal stress protein [Acidimicrobiales bacterium]